MRSSVKPWICLLAILALCCVPVWASDSDPEKKSEEPRKSEEQSKKAAPVPVPEPSARVKAKQAQAATQEACPEPQQGEKPKIAAIVNTFEDVYGHTGSLETLPEGAEPAPAPTAAAAPVTWREVDKGTDAAPEAEPTPESKKDAEPAEEKKSGDQG